MVWWGNPERRPSCWAVGREGSGTRQGLGADAGSCGPWVSLSRWEVEGHAGSGGALCPLWLVDRHGGKETGWEQSLGHSLLVNPPSVPFVWLWPGRPLGEALPGASSSCGIVQRWPGREGRLSGPAAQCGVGGIPLHLLSPGLCMSRPRIISLARDPAVGPPPDSPRPRYPSDTPHLSPSPRARAQSPSPVPAEPTSGALWWPGWSGD